MHNRPDISRNISVCKKVTFNELDPKTTNRIGDLLSGKWQVIDLKRGLYNDLEFMWICLPYKHLI